MGKGIKKLFVLGSLISGLFMALSACDVNPNEQSSNHESSSQVSDSQSSQEPQRVLNSIVAVSNKTSYERGEELDLTVTALYSDQSTSPISNYQVEGFNNRLVGEQTITVSYDGQSCSLKVTVNEPVLVSVSASSNKESFEYGDNLDIVVTANYSDGSSETITDYQVEGYNAKMPGNQNLLISYQGKTCSLGVKVNDPILVNISLQGNKDKYEYGEELHLAVTATYSDGNSVSVNEYEVEGFDNKKPGSQTVTVKYGDKTCSFNVLINDPALVSVTALNVKDTYEYGEDLDIVVNATYADDSVKAVTGYKVEGFDNKKPGAQEVTVKYEDKSYTFNITVNNPVLTSITAVSNKENFEYGDALDVTVYANYSDDTSVEITNYQVEGYNSKDPGIQSLTFTYENKTCTLNVAVNEKRNRFPADKLNSFLKTENIKVSIPTPFGYEKWSDSVEIEQDGSNYFYATTNDEGTIGTDSIADQYVILLRNNGWTVNNENGQYTATKNNGDAQLVFSSDKGVFSLRIDSWLEFPTKKVVGSPVKSKSSFSDGDKMVLGSISEQFVITDFDNGSFNTISFSSSNEEQLDFVAKNAYRFAIKKSGSYYNFIDNQGRKLGATGLGQLAWDEGNTEWAFLLTNDSSIIMNTKREYGRLCYNMLDQKLTTYEKAYDDYLVYPQLYKVSEINVVYPTSISLSGKNVLGINRSQRLRIDYYPANANSINEATWTSSNEDVATVKDGVVKGVSEGKTTITARTKSKNDYLESSFVVEVNESALDNWTIMLYICGSNLESGSGLACSDIAEILRVSGQPDDVNIIMETGGSSYWHNYGISSNALSRYHVRNKQLVLDEKLSKTNMGKQSTFESFLNWGLENYPADNVGVVLWNHGGALGGVCYDDTVGSDKLTNSETSKAFKNVLTAHGIDKLEFIGYDACLMQVQDIAEFNSHYFNYMVGSEESEAGTGWVYDNWIDDVYAGRDTPTILKANCDSFVNRNGGDQTLSYLDLSRMNDYYNKFEAMASAIKSTVKSNYNSFKSLIQGVKSYSGLSSFGVIDGYDFLTKLGNNSTYSAFTSQIDEVKTAYKALTCYSRRGSEAGNSNGLTFVAGAFVSYPQSETSFNNWRSLFY